MKRIENLIVRAVLLFLPSLGISQVTPSYTVTVADPQSTGYYFLTPIAIGPNAASFTPLQMIMDAKGKLVYYKYFPVAGCNDFKLHPGGLMSYGSRNKFFLMDSTFTVIDSIRVKNGLAPDLHDLQILSNGHFLLLGAENETMDLSAYNYFNGNNSPGSTNAIVKCGVIQEQDAAKNVVFEWHCKNYYSFADVDPYFLAGPVNVDWTHLNAVEYDNDGNLLLSVRHFNEITKINRSNGNIMWRLGGNANQFVFQNDAQMFRGQHDIRRISNGHITMFDNGRGQPFHAATAKEYVLDEVNLTANLSWSYVENNTTFSRALGNQQRLPNGKVLVNYGQLDNRNQVFDVIDLAGNKIFEVVFDDTLRSYRSFNYASLSWDLHRPTISCVGSGTQTVLDAGPGHNSYLWNNGATTQTIVAVNTGTYSVRVPKGQGGFIYSEDYVLNCQSCSCVTGLYENKADLEWTLYPNPAGDELNINYRSFSKQFQMTIVNSLGQPVRTADLSENPENSIDLSGLVPGIYFIQAGTLVKKLVKE